MKWNQSYKVLIVFTILIVLVACSNNKDESASNDEESGNQIEIMTRLHTPEVPEPNIEERIEEKTDVELDISWVPDNNYDDRLNTAFSTGTLPDVVYLGFNQFNQFKDAVRDDQFWEIGPYMDEYENLSKLKEDVLDNALVDGKLYSLYQGRPLSRQGLIYRKDWADKLGLDAPTTTDEFYEMAKAFTEEDPDGNGEDDTIGLTDREDLIYGAFKTVSSWFGTPNYWGKQDGELLPEFMFPEYMETMDFFRDMHENGYINQDFPVTSKSDQQNMFKNGSAGLYVGSMGDVGSIYNDAKEINPDATYDVHNRVKGPNGEYGIWAIPGFGSLQLFPKSSVETEEELRKILEFFDKLMKPENANLLNWGVEGEHYTVEDNGAVPDENTQKFEREVKPYQSLPIGEPETNGRYEINDPYEPKRKSEELNKDNENFLITDPSITLESESAIEIGDRLQEGINDATYNYILGEIDKEEFEQAVETWRQNGGEDIIAEYNKSYENSKE
ncbi:extracellular solute-binding protein [Salibacterium salarium]|uniref:Extracellular solute-binding protein n=1 Tax=Salibacterium salarium TaxID=284579 RepID=A0A3R9QX76_9BACI|nr:extracellular solute-binding protein [Salibacterium salarium]RSL35342.1 extracellular solute-binding protein [Salibacterium salarium]